MSRLEWQENFTVKEVKWEELYQYFAVLNYNSHKWLSIEKKFELLQRSEAIIYLVSGLFEVMRTFSKYHSEA